MGAGLTVTCDAEDQRILRVEGRIDTTSAPLLEREISERIEKEQKKLLLDFTRVDYLSSAGLRVLLSATKKLKSRGGVLVFSGIPEDVMQIIKMAGFERILPIYPTEKDALTVLG